ncbi:MAG: hypothetical protein SV487_09045 [Thermodesulfobacteriota bacterium]|nr:hypothetical protein [Thermodesulfobacteriota bacterium]
MADISGVRGSENAAAANNREEARRAGDRQREEAERAERERARLQEESEAEAREREAAQGGNVNTVV